MVETAKDTKPTYVLTKTKNKVKGFAGMKGMEILDAYDLLVTEGLKALGYGDMAMRIDRDDAKSPRG